MFSYFYLASLHNIRNQKKMLEIVISQHSVEIKNSIITCQIHRHEISQKKMDTRNTIVDAIELPSVRYEIVPFIQETTILRNLFFSFQTKDNGIHIFLPLLRSRSTGQESTGPWGSNRNNFIQIHLPVLKYSTFCYFKALCALIHFAVLEGS